MSDPSAWFIALLRADQVCAPGDSNSQSLWRNGVAVYYDPGAVSSCSGETLSYCFLEIARSVFGGTSVGVYSSWHANLPDPLAAQAIRQLDRERSRREANQPDGWRERVRPHMWEAAERLYRLVYVLPDDTFLSSLRQHLEAYGSLSEKQREAVERNFRERDGADGLRRLQHTLWRLRRLAEIELSPQDAETVARFQREAQSRRGLDEKKKPVIGAIEAQYGNQRLEATRLRAAWIVEWLQETPIKV
ncbi:MAG: hypothetical protein JW934_19395 [Anaerolineae bacterium]|nr:hypothetical protein [Anaerolineae bacterium]